jgi:hypothetical protein
MPLVERNHEVKTLSAYGPDQALTECIRLGAIVEEFSGPAVRTPLPVPDRAPQRKWSHDHERRSDTTSRPRVLPETAATSTPPRRHQDATLATAEVRIRSRASAGDLCPERVEVHSRNPP